MSSAYVIVPYHPHFVNLFRKVYKVNVICTKLIIVRKGVKAYVKNPRVFLREKSAKRDFMKYSSHSSTASGSYKESKL